MEFTEAESNMNDLTSEYCFSIPDTWIDDDYYGEEEEEQRN